MALGAWTRYRALPRSGSSAISTKSIGVETFTVKRWRQMQRNGQIATCPLCIPRKNIFCNSVYFSSSSDMTSSCPTKRTWMLFFSFTASTAPLIISSGAWSPPIASSTTRTSSCIGIPPYSHVYKKIYYNFFYKSIYNHICVITVLS